MMLAPSILQPSRTSLFNLFPWRINSGGAKYLAVETNTTTVMWKFLSVHFDHILLDPFNTTTLHEIFF